MHCAIPPCPLLLMRPPSDAAEECQREFRNVLVPVDGSSAANEVVGKVAPYLAEGGKVTVLQATDYEREARPAQ